METYGLLTFQDFQKIVDKYPVKDFVFPCNNFLDDLGNDLLGEHLYTFEKRNSDRVFHFLLEKCLPRHAFPSSVACLVKRKELSL